MLSFHNITLEAAHYRWYGARCWSPLLQGITLDVAPGELVALVGGSGEGKSLLLQCALDLLPVNLRSHGTLSLDGKPLSADGRHACAAIPCAMSRRASPRSTHCSISSDICSVPAIWPVSTGMPSRPARYYAKAISIRQR